MTRSQAKFQKMKILDIIKSPTLLTGKKVEVEGIARGVQDRGSYLGLRTGYTAFLQDEDSNFILIMGNCDGYTGAMEELSMLKTSSETERSVIIQGKVGSKPPYTLHVRGVKFGEYTTILYGK